jgi:predicted AAA+ superfamily ATPase
MYIDRNITDIIYELLEDFKIVSINGPRQTGKTTLSKKIAQALGMKYYTFDNESTLNSAKNDPVNFIKYISNTPCVIDEIQLVPQIVSALKMCVDNNNQNGMFLLTGSADLFKMGDIKESLAGRMVSVNLFTLSSYEMQNKKENIIDNLFSKSIIKSRYNKEDFKTTIEKIVRGGYPAVYQKSARSRESWFESYIEARIQKDLSLIKRLTNDNKSQINRLIKILGANTSNILKYSSIAKHLNIKDMTVKSDIEILQALYLVKRVNPYFTNKGKREIKAPKIQFIDTGLVSYLLDVDVDTLILSQRTVLGNLIENYVYSELLKHTTYSSKSTKIYHYRDGDFEVDLVLEQNNGNIIGIEVKSTATIKSSDLRGLVKLAQNSSDSFICGYIFYGGNEILPISKDGYDFWMIPLSVL